MIALAADLLFTPDTRIERGCVLIEDGVIAAIAPRDQIELPRNCEELCFPGAALFPGFIDLHIHGSAGHDVMEEDPGALPAISRMLLAHAVTSYVPTTVTAPMEQTLRALERLANAIEQNSTSGARPIGIHLEGPFISHAKRGVHPPGDILPPDVRTFDRLWQAARGRICLMTVAPELEGAGELIREAVRRGVCVSLGHSDATFQLALDGIAAGARHATHTFNAMRPLDHREPGVLGAVLTAPEVTADIIADGIHLAPSIVDLFLKTKGLANAVLITDAISATGMPEGRYRLGAFEVDVLAGKCTTGGKLAGSVLTLDRAVRNVMNFAGLNLQQAVGLVTANPARVLKARNGSLHVGARADIAVLAPDGAVIRAFADGR
jgi:N-acetylglucosamine-6-phosphate deacetylase